MNTLDDIAAAMDELRKAEEAVNAKRAVVHAKITAASQNKVIKQVDLTRVTGYSRETIRKIVRAAEGQ
ncbi:hypothetical protein ACPCSP_33795 [Streptomyces cinereoruber]|uniref:hypothetical protein n=1 Tax=Streptomyces cinereoruber TaxID=67260 RepID=UPI003C2F8FA6